MQKAQGEKQENFRTSRKSSSLVWSPGFFALQKYSVGLLYCSGGVKRTFKKVLGLGTEEKRAEAVSRKVTGSILFRSTRQSTIKAPRSGSINLGFHKSMTK